MAMNPIQSRSASKFWYVLLVAPFVALLWVPFYNSTEPVMWGFPFFYWYQFLWVFLTSGIIIWVHHKVG
jgi:FtsH-binding integral membrane protein